MHADLDVLQVTADSLGQEPPTHQEMVLLQGMLHGLPARVAAKNAGIDPLEAVEVAARPHVAAIFAYLRDQELGGEVNVTRDMVNMMFFDAYAKSANTMEMVAAAREIGKLNGLYAPTKVEQTVTHENKTEKQMKSMSSDELAKLAGEGDIVDGEFTEVDDGQA